MTDEPRFPVLKDFGDVTPEDADEWPTMDSAGLLEAWGAEDQPPEAEDESEDER